MPAEQVLDLGAAGSGPAVLQVLVGDEKRARPGGAGQVHGRSQLGVHGPEDEECVGVGQRFVDVWMEDGPVGQRAGDEGRDEGDEEHSGEDTLHGAAVTASRPGVQPQVSGGHASSVGGRDERKRSAEAIT